MSGYRVSPSPSGTQERVRLTLVRRAVADYHLDSDVRDFIAADAVSRWATRTPPPVGRVRPVPAPVGPAFPALARFRRLPYRGPIGSEREYRAPVQLDRFRTRVSQYRARRAGGAVDGVGFIGAIIGAAASIGGSLIGGTSAKRAAKNERAAAADNAVAAQRQKDAALAELEAEKLALARAQLATAAPSSRLPSWVLPAGAAVAGLAVGALVLARRRR